MPRVRRTALGLAAALLSGAAAAACSSEAGSSGDAGFVSVSGESVIQTVPVGERERPGEVAGETLEGEPLALSDHAGKVVVVNVWGSWCAPCRAEADDLAEADRALPDDEVAFVGINSRDPSRAAAQTFQRQFDVPYPSIYDPDGETLLAFHGTLAPNAIPTTLVLDEQGRVAARILNEVTTSTLLAVVEEATGVSASETSGASGG